MKTEFRSCSRIFNRTTSRRCAWRLSCRSSKQTCMFSSQAITCLLSLQTRLRSKTPCAPYPTQSRSFSWPIPSIARVVPWSARVLPPCNHRFNTRRTRAPPSSSCPTISTLSFCDRCLTRDNCPIWSTSPTWSQQCAHIWGFCRCSPRHLASCRPKRKSLLPLTKHCKERRWCFMWIVHRGMRARCGTATLCTRRCSGWQMSRASDLRECRCGSRWSRARQPTFLYR
jgi:hypothetical protein